MIIQNMLLHLWSQIRCFQKRPILRVLNALTKQRTQGSIITNPEFWGSDWDLALSGDVFWENPCMVCLRKM